MQHLDGIVQHYAWGSASALPDLLGVARDGEPWAELWLGAHPSAPSRLADGRPLDAAIAADPVGWLGAASVARFGPRLPFLLKVLAAGQPLSLQAHPTEAQAIAGFARENDLGIPLDAPERVYKDPHHKPELICALTPFDALCGFRPLDATAELLQVLAGRGAHGLAPFAALLADAGADPAGALGYTVGSLLTMPAGDQRLLVDTTAAACAAAEGPDPFATSWMVRLAERYPGDVGAVVSLLLNGVRLAPGEAIALEAGNLHAYLEGTGIEIMANSDNVLRGGLTPKHIDVPELLRVVDFTPLADPVVRQAADGSYPTRAPEFRLTRTSGDGGARRLRGAEIALCTAGAARGTALITPASAGSWEPFATGADEVFVASVGDVVAPS